MATRCENIANDIKSKIAKSKIFTFEVNKEIMYYYYKRFVFQSSLEHCCDPFSDDFSSLAIRDPN